MIRLPNWFLPKRHYFGLSIGRTSLRAVEVNNQGKVTAAAEVLLDKGIYEAGIIVNQDGFITAVKKLLQIGKFTTNYVVVCFSEIHAYTREYRLPIIAKEEIGEAISWHVNELFPFPKEEIYYDWRLLETTQKEYKAAVVAVQKKVIDPLIQALINCGLKPLRFEPGTSAITRLLNFTSTQQALIAEINRVGAYVSLVEGDKALFTTVVNFTSGETGEVYFKNIVQTLNEVINFYKNKGILHDQSVYILLTGELATEEWAQALSNQCGYSAKIFRTPAVNPAFNKAYSAAMTIINTLPNGGNINLLPDNIKEQYHQELNILFYKSLLWQVSAIMILLCLSAGAVYTLVGLERQRLENQVTRLNQVTKTEGSQMQDLLLLNSHAKNIIILAPQRVTPKDKLLVIQNLIPDGLTIAQWEYDDIRLQFTLSGIANNRETLLLFKSKLEQSDEFTKITLPLGSLETPENVKFTLTFITK